MAIQLPIVLVNGQFQRLQAGDTLDIRAEAVQYVNDEATPVLICSPVYNDAAGGFKKAQANAAGTKDVIGLVSQAPSIANGLAGAVTIDGQLSATTAQWDAVAGTSGGLTFKTRYYLDPATPGKITSVAPSTTGQYVCEIGIAESTTDMKINVMPTILL
jgi:hypothetical protein